jgi:hypothetical protein
MVAMSGLPIRNSDTISAAIEAGVVSIGSDWTRAAAAVRCQGRPGEGSRRGIGVNRDGSRVGQDVFLGNVCVGGSADTGVDGGSVGGAS